MVYKEISVKRTEEISTIVLNRPDLMNSLSSEMVKELMMALEYASGQQDIKVIVITGSGRVFSAGGDINALALGMSSIKGRDYVEEVNGVIRFITGTEKPVIAAVNGYAVGAGCNLALAADLVIASTNARFSEAFLQMGLVPDAGGTFFLPRLVGLHKARELVYTGRVLDALEAEKIGLINRVVEPGELEEAVASLAKQLANGPSRALGLTKMLFSRSLNTNLDDALAFEAFIQGICMQTDDHREGIKAFFEKRSPQFSGR